MYRKIIFIFFYVFQNMSLMTKGSLLLFFGSLFIYLISKTKPFLYSNLNLLEFRSNFSVLITVFAGCLYITEFNEFIKFISFAFVVIINLRFLFKWIHAVIDIMIKQYYSQLEKFMPNCLKFYFLFKKTFFVRSESMFSSIDKTVSPKKIQVNYNQTNQSSR